MWIAISTRALEFPALIAKTVAWERDVPLPNRAHHIFRDHVHRPGHL